MAVLIIFFGLIMAVVGSVNGVAPEDDQAKFYVVKQQNLTVNFTNVGARIVSLYFPDKDGKVDDIVLGYDLVEEMKVDKFNFNSIVGRVANRIGSGQFTLNGTTYKLDTNEGRTTLNGGSKGFGNVVWEMTNLTNYKYNTEITFTYKSFDGEEGFPGDITVEVKYVVHPFSLYTTITARVENKSTPINIGQNLVFNLAGHNSGDVSRQDLQILSKKIVELNKDLLPTGKIIPIIGTGYDFRNPENIGLNMVQQPNGYDVNYVIPHKRDNELAAIAIDRFSGRSVVFATSAPTVHIWTANEVKDVKGKGGVTYQPQAGFSLDGQGFPDAVNHPEFPSQIYTKGQTFRRENSYSFSFNDNPRVW